MQIANNTVVTLRYVMKNAEGDILENIIEGTAVEYLHGSGNILPQLEMNLVGLKAGDKKSVSFTNESNLQLTNEKFYFDIIIDTIRMATEQELLKGHPIQLSDNNNCGPDCCC